MLEQISSFLAKETNIDENRREIISFGLESLFSTFFSTSLVLIVSFFLKTELFTFIILLSSAFIKTFAGGAHCKTMLNCGIFSAVVFAGLSKLVQLFIALPQITFVYVAIFAVIFSFLSHYKWAPAKTPEKPISNQYSAILRKSTFKCLILSYLVIYALFLVKASYPIIISACFGIIWHTFTITPLGYRVISIADQALSWATKRR